MAKPRDLNKYRPRHIKFTNIKNNENMMEVEEQVRGVEINNRRKSYIGKTWDAPDDCGKEGPPAEKGGRIVGGEETGERQWPWMVAMFVDDAWFCGGSLVSNQVRSIVYLANNPT